MASFPSNGYSEVMSGTNNYTGSNFYGSSCPKTPIVPVSNDDLTNKLYVDSATGGGIIGNLTDKGSLITGDGTQAVIFDQNPYQTALTTSTVYDWNALANGQSRVFSTPNVLLIPLGAELTITYSVTDSITGILTAITAFDITITITAFASAVYTSTTLYNSNPFVTVAGSDIDPDFDFLSPPSAFTSSLIVTAGLTGIYSAPSNVPYTIDILTSFGSVLLGSSVPGVTVASPTPSSFTYTEGVYIPNGQAFFINFNTAGQPVNWGLALGGSLSQPFSYFGTIDGYTLPYSSGSIVLNDDICLVADPLSTTGLAWGVINTASIGAVTSVSGGTNIVMSGTIPAPVVNLANPLTSELNMGAQSLRDSASAVGTSGQILSAGTGGQTLWTAATTATVVNAGTNISVTGTSSAPIVNLLNPLTAELNMGAQSLRDSASAVGTSGQILSCGTGGQTLWAAATSGNPTITDTNTNATYYPTFVAGSGVQPLLADISTGPISLNPSNGNFNIVSTLKLTQSELAIGLGAGGTQGIGAVAIGLSAGQTNQGAASVAIGSNSGATNQGGGSFAIGSLAGFSNQGAGCIAIGASAGQTSQTAGGIAIGNSSGTTAQGNGALAIGGSSGNANQGASAVAVGTLSGNANQGAAAVAIGLGAGSGLSSGQGANAIAIGNLAGYDSQTAGSICLNATGVAVNPAAAGFFVAPIRSLTGNQNFNLQYNSTTSEVIAFPNVQDVMMEDFDMFETTSGFTGSVLSFAETGSGNTTYFNGTYEAAILNGSLYRRGAVQLFSGTSSGFSTQNLTDLLFSYANISKVTFGIVPHGNQNLSTATVAAGNIVQQLGITSSNSGTGTQTSNTVIWRLSSASATIPTWQFVINNVVQYTLTITPGDMTAKWCRAEIAVVYGGGSTATVTGTWYNLTDGTSETTGTYTITAGTGFPSPLTTPNTVGIVMGSYTANATAKYMGVDYVELQQVPLLPVGSGTTETTGR
jgi:hypothetical protein